MQPQPLPNLPEERPQSAATSAQGLMVSQDDEEFRNLDRVQKEINSTMELEQPVKLRRLHQRRASYEQDLEAPPAALPKQWKSRRNCCLTFGFYLKVACQSIKRKYCQFCLGLLACFVVVLVTLVANTVLANGALIFFSTAEGNVGQKDMVLENSDVNANGRPTFLNATQIASVLTTQVPGYTPAPRFQLDGCFLCDGPCNNTQRETEAKIIALDTSIQQTIGLGSQYPHKDPMAPRECQISENHARRFNLAIGDTVHLRGVFSQILEVLIAKYSQAVSISGIVNIDCVLTNTYAEPGGRMGDSAKDVVYFEMQGFMQSLAPYVSPYDPNFSTFIEQQNAHDYATEVIVNFKDPRIDMYLESDYNAMQAEGTKIASKIVAALGFYPVNMDLPIMSQLRVLSLGSVFFGIILSLVVVLLAVLSIMLIYSLLLVSIESRTFEIGVMRMIGVSKCGLVGLLLTQAFTFVIPALLLGFIASFPILFFISNIFKEQVGYGFIPAPSGLSVLYALLLGIGIPVISALVPILIALRRNLSESLDYTRSHTQAVIYKILKPSKANILLSLGLGIVAVVFGVGIYYFLPLSIVSFNFALLFNIFFAILIAMLVGFVLLALNAQHLLEIIFVYLLLFWERRATKKLVLKNLTAHRLRNRKTSLMYALSLSFSIMIISAYTMQLKASELTELKNNGVYLRIGSGSDNIAFDWSSMRTAIHNHPNVVQSFSLATFPPPRMDSNDVSGTSLSDTAALTTIGSGLYGVSPHVFKPMIKDFLNVNSRSSSALDLGQQLYTARGSQGFGSGAYIQEETIVDSGSNSTVLMNLQEPEGIRRSLVHPLWSLNQAPGFSAGDRASTWQFEHVLVSYPAYRRLTGYRSITEIPIERVFLKLKSGVSNAEINAFMDEAVDTNAHPNNLDNFDFRDLQNTVSGVQSLLDTIFSLVLVIVMLLCFFSLVAAMTANILDQAKEIAVLRAVGLTRWRVVWVYVYEAFILVFASSMLGVFIGTLVGWTMVLQRVLFVQLPLTFYFPYWQTLAVFLVAVLTAFASSCAPARTLLRKQIAQIIRTHA